MNIGADSASHPSHASLLRMVNQIAANFEHKPVEQAAPAVAQHLRDFWTPWMLDEIQVVKAESPDRLSPLASAAVDELGAASC